METSFHSISFSFRCKIQTNKQLAEIRKQIEQMECEKEKHCRKCCANKFKAHTECELRSSFQFGVVFAFEQSSTVVVVSVVHVSLAGPILRFELEMVGAVPFRWILLVFPIYVRCALYGIENTCQLFVLGFFCVYFWFWAVGTFSKYFLQLSTYSQLVHVIWTASEREINLNVHLEGLPMPLCGGLSHFHNSHLEKWTQMYPISKNISLGMSIIIMSCDAIFTSAKNCVHHFQTRFESR